MAHIVVLGAGLGGIPMTYEMKALAGRDHKVTVVNNNPYFQFTPSNPWVGVGWRKKKDVVIDLAPIFKKHGINFVHATIKKLHPDENRVELEQGEDITYDYLIIATGPELAFDKIEGLGPDGYTQSVCQVDHAVSANDDWEA
ncbi:MAG TPA: NAD(P)/FAD-dependent oxidoreductase, partial [Rhizobiales bacterium]|nr:NAD(P)/FAD-dependent oxidoreductase [Hyphomicrobiales bacterium]